MRQGCRQYRIGIVRPCREYHVQYRIEVSGVRTSCETEDRNSFWIAARLAPRVTKMVPMVYPAMATAQNESNRMPPTTATDFEPPMASRMIPRAVINIVGSSAVNVNVRRARLRNLVVGLRRRKPCYSGR